jgi:hypothetical protein
LAKNLPSVDLPGRTTAAGDASLDVFVTTKAFIKDEVKSLQAICAMFDSWTDRYKSKPYIALSIAFMKDWQFKVVTLSCRLHSVADHFLVIPEKLWLNMFAPF